MPLHSLQNWLAYLEICELCSESHAKIHGARLGVGAGAWTTNSGPTLGPRSVLVAFPPDHIYSGSRGWIIK